MKNLSFKNKQNAGLWVFSALAAALLFTMLLLSRDAGMSGDEHFHLGHARDVVSFYKTLGKDSTAVHINPKNGASDLHMFGQLPDNISYLIYDTLGIDNIMAVRHAVSSTFGWIAMLFAALLVFRVSRRWPAAILTLALFFFSPRFLGHSFNNLKDPPFAAMVMMGIYYLFRFFQTFPKPPRKVVAMAAVSIGLALATRIGGLLLIGYFGVFGVAYFAAQCWALRRREDGRAQAERLFQRLLLYGLGISAAGFALGVLLWPYALVSPLAHVRETFQSMSHWNVILRHVYEGKMVWSDTNPWYYLPKYILITAPLAVILGAVAYLFAGGLKKENRFGTFVVYFALIFPVFWIIYTGANLYGGWRHATFMYPPLVAAAGLGFSALAGIAKRRYIRLTLWALPVALLLQPMLFVARNHPYEYVYFNPLVDGIKGAYGSYEMDYYYHSTREASEWVKADVARSGAPDSARKTKVVAWHPASVKYFFRHDTADFSVGFVRWNERGNSDWDYAIFSITGINPELLKSAKAFPPKNTAYQIKVDGVPICIVLKREDRHDLRSYQALQQGQLAEATALAQQALAYDPYSEQALSNLITAYSHAQEPDSVLRLAKHWAGFNKGNTTALNYLAEGYYNRRDFANAMVAANAITKLNPREISGLWIAANIYAQENNPNAALRCLNRVVQLRGNFKPAYQLMAQMYERTGNRQQAQRIMQAIKNAPN
ncbi:MAG: phospholipid carrier-dependent glycosyltransferase [Prevotellaceae bacterium]|jgi:hypothetical protein|nr:phospholipid carrier-dependent glycosyltransferase [Prevotellaceae bacterium]